MITFQLMLWHVQTISLSSILIFFFFLPSLILFKIACPFEQKRKREKRISQSIYEASIYICSSTVPTDLGNEGVWKGEKESFFFDRRRMKKKKKKMETFIYIYQRRRKNKIFSNHYCIVYIHLAPNDDVILNQFKLMHADTLIQICLMIKTKFFFIPY